MAHCENKAHLERNRLQLQLGTKELRHKILHFLGFQAIRDFGESVSSSHLCWPLPVLIWPSSLSRLNQERLPGSFVSHTTNISGRELAHSPASVHRPSEPVEKRSQIIHKRHCSWWFATSLFRDTENSKVRSTEACGYYSFYAITFLMLCLGHSNHLQPLNNHIYLLGRMSSFRWQ